MSQPSLIYLDDADVRAVGPPMAVLIEILERVFEEKGRGQIEMPPKPGIHTQPDAFIHAMPAYIPALGAAGVKWVSGYPRNPSRGLPYISGLIILNELETGLPYCIMDCAWITAYRTAAATAVAARRLARPESQVAGILACGVQGRTNLLALATVFDLQRVYAYDLDSQVQGRFVDEMSGQLGLEIVGVEEPRRAVEQSQLVVTSGPILKDPRPTIGKDWLPPGAFACAVDFDSYWTAEALAQFDRIVTDDHAQLQYYRELGYFRNTPEPYADLGQLATGERPGREGPEERTLALNLGLALEDMAVAVWVYEQARQRGLGRRLDS